MLEYENQMVLDCLHEDGLLVCAKGLSIETVFLSLIKIYCDPANLVIILNTNPYEEKFVITELEKQNVSLIPKIITAENSIPDRERIYAEGGILFVSSRIIVVDLLKHRIPIENITGFIVWKAHKILHLHQTAFALRLYRLENKTGFIKAFSSCAEAFTRKIIGVERVMKTLFVRNLYLWPRFHAVVHSNIEKTPCKVVELHLELTHSMKTIQMSLLSVMQHIINEIKRLNPTIDTEDITVQNVLSASFHKLLKIQLDPIWNQLNGQTKNLLSDMKILRHLLSSLYEMDCFQFYTLLKSLRSINYVQRSSGWMLLDAGEKLFLAAEERLSGNHGNVAVEPHPKWKVLACTFKEIRQSSNQSETVLVLVKNMETCRQLKSYLLNGPEKVSSELYEKYMGTKSELDVKQNVDSVLNTEQEPDDGCFKLTQKMDSNNDHLSYSEYSLNDEDSGAEPIIILQHFKKENIFFLPTQLELTKSCYIIMYNINMKAIRQLEVYQAKHPELKLTVFILMFDKSTDEQAYLLSLNKEKSAFEHLIQEKQTMAVPIEQDGKSGDCPLLTREAGKPVSETVNTRKGGETAVKCNPVVIVDMREFRSELPVLLHRRGIDIEPITLLVGDYILTPEICVERKSVNDLIGSLNSGRLYQQTLAMTRHYAKPVLLIEFDAQKSFGFEGRYFLSKDMSSIDITNKLQLLTLHFPKLRIIWSPSPHISAKLFHEIKDGKEEPDSSIAATIGQTEGSHEDGKYNSAIKDFVSKLPGITMQNIYTILDKTKSLENLITLSQDELKHVLKNSSQAENLYDALHKEYTKLDDKCTKESIPKKRFRVRKKNLK